MSASRGQLYELRKREAYSFLRSLESTLNDALLPASELRKYIRETVRVSKADKTRKHLRLPESVFLNEFVVPSLAKLMATHGGMGSSKAKEGLLSEYQRMREEFCSGSPARTERHPFTKVMGAAPTAIMRQWMSGRDNALTQSCPDIATRDPFPFKIVFEAKYFERGGPGKAATELVNSIYQAFFYRALPYVSSRKSGPAWDYEFACMLAGDASDEGSLENVWKTLPSTVKRGFWEGANIYVMIVRHPRAAEKNF